MRFTDNNIKLNINGLWFKAFLEDSDVNHVIKEQQLPFSPISFVNDSMVTRVNETAKFTFNVFSETRGECIQNYNSLLKLLNSIKPTYNIMDDQYVPAFSNTTGFVSLTFSGMPVRKTVRLHLNNFNYSVNKELGYLEVTQNEIDDYNKAQYYNKNMRLVPLAYKISLEGKILLDFNQTAKVIGGRIKGSKADLNELMSSGAGTQDLDKLNQLKTQYKGVTGKPIETLRAKEIPWATSIIASLSQQELIDNNGNYITLPEETERTQNQRNETYQITKDFLNLLTEDN